MGRGAADVKEERAVIGERALSLRGPLNRPSQVIHFSFVVVGIAPALPAIGLPPAMRDQP